MSLQWCAGHPTRLLGDGYGALRVSSTARSPTREARFARFGGACIESALARQPARPRLVHLLRGRHPDRLRPVPFGLSDDPEVDAGRYRPGPFHRQHRQPAGPGAGRLGGRLGALQAARRRARRHRHRPQRAHHRRGAAVRDDRRRQAAACRLQLGAGPGSGRHHAGLGRSCRRRPAPGPQRAVRRHRQRTGGRRDGGLRLFRLCASRVLRHRGPGDTGRAGPIAAYATPTWIQCGPTAASTLRRKHRRHRPQPAASATPPLSSSRPASCFSTWRMRQCCRWSAAT